MGGQLPVKTAQSADFLKTFIHFTAADTSQQSDFCQQDTWLPRRGSRRQTQKGNTSLGVEVTSVFANSNLKTGNPNSDFR